MSVAVIGAGLAGQAAAIEAARSGAPVTVFEARPDAGGRARTHERAGFLVNEGPHALYVGGPAHRFLQDLGHDPAGGVPRTDRGVGVDGSTVGPMPVGARSLLRTPLLRGDRVGFGRLVARLGRLDPADHADVTVDRFVADVLGRGPGARIAHALARLSTYGNDPGHVSADALVTQMKLAAGDGVRYLDGGWRTIVEILAAEAARLGVETRLGAKVERILWDRGTVEVVGPAGREPFDQVVLAPGGPAAVSRLLGDASPSAARWAAAAHPAEVAVLDVGLAAPGGSAPPFALGIDRPLYLSVHAPVAALAPSGHTLVHVARYLPFGEAVDPDRDRAQCEALLDQVQPAWRAHAAHVGFQRRLVAATDQPRALDGGMAGRPAATLPECDRIQLAGDWVGSTGLLADAAVASGCIAGRRAAAGSRVTAA
ncbi:MAG: FAD-dependent oxidoreductase [Acidimicrobiales bacterium]